MKAQKVFTVGVNDADYKVSKRGSMSINGHTKILWMCPFYVKWKDMLRRCYDTAFLNRQTSYNGCTVSPEWLTFSNFKAWMEQQDWEGKELDKDLLGDGKLYSPESCVFIDKEVNSFMGTGRGGSNHPIGVSYRKDKQKYVAHCNCVLTKKLKNLGYFDNPEEAHVAWIDFKLEQAKILAIKQTDPRVANALTCRYEKLKPKHN